MIGETTPIHGEPVMTAKMKLVAFRVTTYRSVEDSDWIDADDVTAMIGTNESGKTNLLLPLWKLNPANEGEINLLSDAPRKDYSSIRNMEPKPDFIHARFELAEATAKMVAIQSGRPIEEIQTVEVCRDYDGHYGVHFPNANEVNAVEAAEVVGLLRSGHSEIEGMQPSGKSDTELKAALISAVSSALEQASQHEGDFDAEALESLSTFVTAGAIESAPTRSTVAPRFGQLADAITKLVQRLRKPGPGENEKVTEMIIKWLPSFVYYSTYGNLDSEIYLPHVIDDLDRDDLTGKAEARARTLRVLFSFVQLSPQEILELGRDWDSQGQPTQEQIESLNEKKKERSVLLQSASTTLTEKFREWWKQGEYRIRFEADGNHFRIWVSDDKRPEEIELEGRSTGLQWFLSFYLIFLVESSKAHNGAILLLDEPGHSLHPIAQNFLSEFFESLAASNQLLYTTHSPFLVDADHLDRVRAVFVDDDGHTNVSSNLRAGQVAAKANSIYPVHAALGLSVSDTLFQGCKIVIVEGQSDQLYLSAIKTALVSLGKYQPKQELLFVPTSGAKAIKTVAAILSGREGDLPHVLCDADHAGLTLASTLRSSLYSDSQASIHTTGDLLAIENTEVEDLIPASFASPTLDRYLKGPIDRPFTLSEDRPIVPQVKEYAEANAIELSKGWKVEVARLMKLRLAATDLSTNDWTEAVSIWVKLFESLDPKSASSSNAKPITQVERLPNQTAAETNRSS